MLNGDGWAEAFNGVHVRTLHLVKKLARVSGERLHIAALAFSIDSVKGKRGFARAAETGNHRKRVARYLDRDVFQVVLAGAAHRDLTDSHGPYEPWAISSRTGLQKSQVLQ